MARVDFAAHDMIEGGASGDAPEDLFEMGMMYSAGRDVEPDLVQAHKWFNLAALRGSQDGRLYRSEIAKEMSKDEIAEAQRIARIWLIERRR